MRIRTAIRAAVAATLAASLLGAVPAAADPPAGAAPAPDTDLAVDVAPVLGTAASTALGWNEVVVLVRNNGTRPARGHVDVTTTQYGRVRHDFRATAPFSVGAGAAVDVRVPALVAMYADLTVETFDESGAVASSKRLTSFTPGGVTLLDVGETRRLGPAIDGAAVSPLFTAAIGGSRGGGPLLSVTSPRYDPATGDPILPDRAALYDSVDAVLVRSDVLARLEGPELDALAGYVLAGGTLAIAVSRPEDLRHPTITAFAGGAVMRRGVSAETLADLTLPEPPSSLSSSPRLIPHAREPSSDLVEALSGYAGGNLHGSLYGSSAPYGLGEVHLLAFDPTRRPAVDDPWAEARVIDLARRAFDRRSSQIFRPGSDPSSASYARVRRELDPNEGSRWAIAAAALLLVVYSVLAGPISFSAAARAGRPLRALRRLPLFSAAAFALVVAIGVAAKGVTGRARHLTLVEAGAGMPRGSARRFRGFYASRTKDLTVRPSDAGSVVSTVLADSSDRRDHLMVDRDGARLVDVAALPWQTVVVREDGFASIGDGVALVEEGEGDVAVVNRTGHDLRAAVLRSPRGEVYYFPRIKDGDRATTLSARRMSADPDGRLWEGALGVPAHGGGLVLHPLDAHGLRPVIEPDAPGLADAWWAVSDAAGAGAVDWFPDGVPVLIGQLDGGEGRTSDSGLHLDRDRLLLRVVGWGGRP